MFQYSIQSLKCTFLEFWPIKSGQIFQTTEVPNGLLKLWSVSGNRSVFKKNCRLLLCACVREEGHIYWLKTSSFLTSLSAFTTLLIRLHVHPCEKTTFAFYYYEKNAGSSQTYISSLTEGEFSRSAQMVWLLFKFIQQQWNGDQECMQVTGRCFLFFLSLSLSLSLSFKREQFLRFLLRFCRTWTKCKWYLITLQTRVERISWIHHRTILK